MKIETKGILYNRNEQIIYLRAVPAGSQNECKPRQ